jgi:hypothetical protein
VHRTLTENPPGQSSNTMFHVDELVGPQAPDGTSQPRVVFRTNPLSPPFMVDASFGRVLAMERRSNGIWWVKIRVDRSALFQEVKVFESVDTDEYSSASSLEEPVVWVPGDVVVPVEGDEYLSIPVTYH